MEQSDIEYLRDAFKDARTEIEGGVALSGFIGVRDTEQNVAAAMAGYNPTGESDYPLIFAGAQQGNVEYYGWTSNSYTHIYTQSATPSNGDNCFDNKGSVVGTVTNIVGAQIFALSTTGETYQRNTGIDFTAKTPSAMEATGPSSEYIRTDDAFPITLKRAGRIKRYIQKPTARLRNLLRCWQFPKIATWP